MELSQLFTVALNCISLVTCSYYEPFVVGGQKADISWFPHVAYLATTCKKKLTTVAVFACGSSILNQRILLTAGHCVNGCKVKARTDVYVGHANCKLGTMYPVEKTYLHEHYSDVDISNDIGLVKLKTDLVFGPYVKRLMLKRKPPFDEEGIIAGWGLINEIKETTTDELKFVKQYVLPKMKCGKILSPMPSGTICASHNTTTNYVSAGDSGSALVVRRIIPIGLVSYKEPDLSRSVTVYTSVPYFYDWILEKSFKLMCK